MALFSPAKIAQVSLNCTDLARAKEFYCGALCLALVGELPDSIFVKCGEVNLIVQKVEQPRRASQIYFSADGCVDEATAALKAQGIAFGQEPRRIAQFSRRRRVARFLQRSLGQPARVACQYAACAVITAPWACRSHRARRARDCCLPGL